MGFGLLLEEGFLGGTTDLVGEGVATITNLAWDWKVLAAGVVLIIAAVLVFLFIKKLIVNSILGVIAWAVLVFGLKIEMDLIVTLIVSAVFGLAGVGVILLLKFLGIPI